MAKLDGDDDATVESKAMLVPLGILGETHRSGQPTSADGQPMTVEGLLQDHYATVFRYAYRLTGETSAAEDVSQEVFMRAMVNLHQLREPAAVRGWLMAITRNEFARWCKKNAVVRGDGFDTDREDHSGGSESQIDRAEWVQVALNELPPDYRIIVHMYYFERLSYNEIARQLAIPIGTVMSRLNRGKAHLKRSLLNLAEPRELR